MIEALKQQVKHTPVTMGLFTVTNVVFIFELIASHGQTDNARFLVAVGAKWGPDIAHNQAYWRLLTPVFLHAGIMHIVTNMLTLWFVGPIAERAFGSWRFLMLYAFGGIVGNIFSYLLSPLAISVGASSALFAMFAGLILYGVRYRDNPTIRAQGATFLLFVVLNLFSGLLAPTIDLWGHIGGLIGGMMSTVMLGFVGKSGQYALSMRLTMCAVTLLLLILTIYAGGSVS